MNEELAKYDWKGVTYPQDYLLRLLTLARERNPKRILEVGFDQGASAMALLRGAPAAFMTSIDIYPCERGVERLTHSEVSGRHTFIQADSREFLKQDDILRKLGGTFDLIYIDGDHLFDAVMIDLENCSKLLNNRGVMVCDDAQKDHGHFGVYRAVLEFCSTHPFMFKVLPGSPSSMVEVIQI